MVSPVVHGRQDTYAGNCMPFSHNSPRSVCAKTQVLLIVQKTPCFTSCDTAALLGLSLYLGVLLRPQKNAYPPSFQPLNIHIVLHPENIGSALSVHKPLKTWNPGPLTSWDNRCNTSNHLQGKMRTCFGQHKHITRSSSRYDAANATSRESSRWCSLSDGSFWHNNVQSHLFQRLPAVTFTVFLTWQGVINHDANSKSLDNPGESASNSHVHKEKKVSQELSRTHPIEHE